MATQTQLGKLAGSISSPLLPVFVWDDALAALSESAALAAAVAAAPATVFGLANDSGDHAIEQLSDFAWRVGVNYRDYTPSPFPPPPPSPSIQVDYRFNAQAKRKFVKNSYECLGAYSFNVGGSGATEDFPTLHRTLVNVQKVGGVNRPLGMWVDPLEEVHTLDLIIPNATIDATYREALAHLLGRFNNAGFMGYAAGEVQLVRYAGGKRTGDDWQLSMGFGAVETRTNVAFDGYDQANDQYDQLIVPTIKPYAITWEVLRDVMVNDLNTTESLATMVYLQRAWELGDFTLLGLGL